MTTEAAVVDIGIPRLVRIIASRRLERSYTGTTLELDLRDEPRPTMDQKSAIAGDIWELLGVHIGDAIWKHAATLRDLLAHVERMLA